MRQKRTLVSLGMAMILGGLLLSAQSEGQKRPERDRIRENIHRLRLLRLTETLGLSEEQAAKVYPAASRIEKEKTEILRAVSAEVRVLRGLVEESSPDESKLSAQIEKIMGLRRSLRDKDREFEAILEQNLTPVQRAKYLLSSAEFYERVAAGLKKAREQKRGEPRIEEKNRLS